MTAPSRQPRGGEKRPRQLAFGRLVRVFRERAGLTQAALAARLGLSQAHVAQIERGQSYPSLDIADTLASVLHTTLDELLGGASGARVVHYHTPGEVRVQVSNGGLVVFGNYGAQDIENLLGTWMRMREQEEGNRHKEQGTREEREGDSPPSSLDCAEDEAQ